MYDFICFECSVHTLILGQYMKKTKINIPKNLKIIHYSSSNNYIDELLIKYEFSGTIKKIDNHI
jgi:hypothetical protein